MNGIASYANQEMVPPGAIANIRGAADMLERFGREGDIYVVHAAEGETVVPMEVLDSSPSLKKMLFSQMEEMGLKPERYVVGNELNSLNPVTGKPEFFFKKLFKSVKSIFIKAAPILGAIAGSFIAPGIGTALGGLLGSAAGIAGSAIGAGIGSFAASKLTGASTKDALKGAAFSAGTAGLFKGFSMTDFGKNLTSGNIAEDLFGKDLFGPIETSQNNLVNNLMGSSAVSEPSTFSLTPDASQSLVPPVRSFNSAAPVPVDSLMPTATTDSGRALMERFAGKNLLPLSKVQTVSATNPPFEMLSFDEAAARGAASTGTPSTALQTFGATNPRDFGLTNADLAKAKLPNGGNLTFAQKLAAFPSNAVDYVATAAQEQLDNNKLGILGGGALAFLNYQEQQEENERIKKAKEDAQKANSLFAQAFRVGSPGINLGQNPDFRPPQRPMLVKKGGEIPSKGLGDIVPAMLEPGEFVMTRNAVAGAGNGSQKNGIKRMYSMMKDFERRV
jgi:hypothetical protein